MSLFTIWQFLSSGYLRQIQRLLYAIQEVLFNLLLLIMIEMAESGALLRYAYYLLNY